MGWTSWGDAVAGCAPRRTTSNTSTRLSSCSGLSHTTTTATLDRRSWLWSRHCPSDTDSAPVSGIQPRGSRAGACVADPVTPLPRRRAGGGDATFDFGVLAAAPRFAVLPTLAAGRVLGAGTPLPDDGFAGLVRFFAPSFAPARATPPHSFIRDGRSELRGEPLGASFITPHRRARARGEQRRPIFPVPASERCGRLGSWRFIMAPAGTRGRPGTCSSLVRRVGGRERAPGPRAGRLPQAVRSPRSTPRSLMRREGSEMPSCGGGWIATGRRQGQYRARAAHRVQRHGRAV